MNDEPGAEFAELCRRVCAAIESGTVTATELQSLLGEVIVGVHRLPDVFPETDEGEVPYDRRRRLQMYTQIARIATRNIDADYYWDILDPIVKLDASATTLPDPDPTMGQLSDDVADIYCGLWEGLQAWENGHQEEAIWHWRFEYRFVWGRDITDALRILWQVRKESEWYGSDL